MQEVAFAKLPAANCFKADVCDFSVVEPFNAGFDTICMFRVKEDLRADATGRVKFVHSKV